MDALSGGLDAATDPGRATFPPHGLPGGDYAAFVLREVAATGWAVHARLVVDAPAEEVLARINPAVGVVESLDRDHSVLVTGADTIEIVAVYIGMLGLDFAVEVRRSFATTSGPQ